MNLSKGFTDNVITKVDGLVIKTGKCVAAELEWYNAYLDKADIPYIMGEKDGSIVMKYVERSGEVDIDEVVKIVEKYRKYEILMDGEFYWGSQTYFVKILEHIKKNPNITNGKKLLTKLYSTKIEGTFAHGDLSVHNLIPTTTGLKLIDPLYSKKSFGSYVLDYAKLLFSLKFYTNDIKRFNYLRSLVEIPDCLIASECVRVATYKPQFSFIAENLINEL